MRKELANRYAYQGISLPKELLDLIKEHIGNKPQFRTVTSYIKYSIIKQIEEDKKFTIEKFYEKTGMTRYQAWEYLMNELKKTL